MANVVISPNMNLNIPVPGTDPSPDWANNINSCFGRIDLHDHSPGLGVAITPAGMNINADLSFVSNRAINMGAIKFTPLVSPLSGAANLGSIYEAGVDLYYTDGNGNVIRMTSGGAIAGAPGSITGMTPPANVTYVSGSTTFKFQSDVTTPANVDAGSVILRNITPASNGVTLSAPGSLGTNYTITMPTGLPASNSEVMMSSTGALTVNVKPVMISASCGTFNVSAGGGSFTDVTNLSITMTTYGRPIVVALQSDAGGTSSYIKANANRYVQVKLLANSGGPDIELALYQYFNANDGGTTPGNIPTSAVTSVTALAAGTYTFRCQAADNGSTSEIDNAVLVVYEL